MEKRRKKMEYRIVVGEVGNEQGHIISTRAKSIEGALRSLKSELKKYGHDGWGYIEEGDGTPYSWRPVEEDELKRRAKLR